MKNVKEFSGFLNEGKKEEKEELDEALNKVATEYWKKRGAKFGSIQTMKDFKNKDNYASTPTRFNDETKFKTIEAKIEVGGYNGRSIVCALWVAPFKKDGSEGANIRLTWGYTS
jgi:hypothetical protein